MNTRILLTVALRTLHRTFLRSALTVLGVIIGVAAVIVMVSIGEGAKAQVEASFAGLESNQLTLTSRVPERPGGPAVRLATTGGLTLADYAAIQREIDDVSAVSVGAYGSERTVKGNGRSVKALLNGIDPAGLRIRSGKLLQGTVFGESDVQRATNVSVVTQFIADSLFKDLDPIGQRIRIGDVPFVVVGVVADNPAYRNAQQGDTSVFIPYSSVLLRFDRTAPLAVVLKATDPSKLGEIQRAVSDLIERRRGTRTAEFITSNVQEAIRTYTENSRTMTLLLGAIGGISLLVGGVGIMNVMLVSVTERTREIGIRMAVGQRPGDILSQFLLESTVLSVLGGVIGIIVGVAGAYVATHMYDWPTRLTLNAMATAFAFSVIVGIAFGYYPAHRASALDPIEALRAE